MQITISGKDKKSIQKIKAHAKRLGLKIHDRMEKITKNKETDPAELYQLMEDMAASGGVTSIKDPVKWQQVIRKDKKLYGRE